ncbi:cilia- and flagella-associated protein 157 [Lampris incognitus]|uniref:cilia- and flagella-associated protein 157 n=1 Tax=Lampris incognitus TaxID=2546036 RepID=UPI0024B53A39|nr:cilia- and flagella-associated protein 157 [Lampris incognitus]
MSDAKGREFYLSRVQNLESQLERAQQKYEELVVQKNKFSSRYKSLQEDTKDITEYLKHSLKQKEDELADLSERLVRLQQTKERQIGSLELQLSQLQQESEERMDKLCSENRTLAEKLAALEEFREQREKLMGDLSTLDRQLAGERKEHSTAIYELELKADLDKDRLEEEMQRRMAAKEVELRDQLGRQMQDTTARAIHENMAYRVQLGQLSEQNCALLGENRAACSKEQQLRLEVEVLESILKQITRQNRSQLKVVQQLTEKCKQQQTELENLSSAHEEHQLLQTKHQGLLDNIATLSQDHNLTLKECSKRGVEVERLGVELEAERKRGSHLERIIKEAASAVKEALKVVPAEEASEADAMARRNRMMQRLLAVLDGAAVLGTGPTLTDFIPMKSQISQPQSSGPAADSNTGPLGRSGAGLSHFRTRGLGLVPRQTSNHLTTKTTDLKLHRSDV